MKIVTWNCNGALRKKYKNLLDLEADIYVIQECENPEESKDTAYRKWAENYLWLGDNKNKGLAVFVNSDIELEKLDWSAQYKAEEREVKYFLPCLIAKRFNLLAVWTHHNESPTFKYIGQLWKYLKINKYNFNNILIAGDFNSNSIWDSWDRWWNHSDVIKELENNLNIRSLYHLHTGQEQGKEIIPTFYHQRNLKKPYHIDYILGSSEFVKKFNKIEIGKVEQWLEISDHMPIICEFI